MTVYVDDQRIRLGRMLMCHMLSDSDAELHAMAAAIGVARRHWESPERTSGSHYNVCQEKRAAAIQQGAVPITRRQASAMNRRRQETGELGCPRDAIAWWKARRAPVQEVKAGEGPERQED